MNHSTIRYLSFKKCKIGDSGIFVLAPAIRTIKSLAVLNLSACNLTEKGAHIVAAFLKSLAVRRQADRWAASLRQDIPDDPKEVPQDAPKPLKRLIICSNDLGDEGCSPLFDLILEEVGLWAIDLQGNKLSNKSAKRALMIMKNNHDLVVLDLRNNQVDTVHLELLHGLLSKNLKEQIDKSNIKKNDPDLVWLDGKDPLKSIYYEDFEMARQLRQTESSVKKLHFSRHVPMKITKPRSVIVDKKAKTKQKAAMTKLITRMNTMHNEGRMPVKDVTKMKKVTIVPHAEMSNSSTKVVSFSPSLKKMAVTKPESKATSNSTMMNGLASREIPAAAKVVESPSSTSKVTIPSPSQAITTSSQKELNLEILAKQNTEMNERLRALELLVMAILQNLENGKQSNKNNESNPTVEKENHDQGVRTNTDSILPSTSLVVGSSMVQTPLEMKPVVANVDGAEKQRTGSLLDLLSDEELELIKLEVPKVPNLLQKPFEPLFQNLMDEIDPLLLANKSGKPLNVSASPKDIFRTTLDELEDLLLEEVSILEKEEASRISASEPKLLDASPQPSETPGPRIKEMLQSSIEKVEKEMFEPSQRLWATPKEPPLPPKLIATQAPIRMDSFIEALDKILT
jgi:hypothetical protein